VKYSPGCSTVEVEVDRDGGDVAIRVRDWGLGIAPEEQREIFQKFSRGSAAVNADVKGTGIGLAIVDHIVRGHGGRILLDSSPGAGSTFTILLKAKS